MPIPNECMTKNEAIKTIQGSNLDFAILSGLSEELKDDLEVVSVAVKKVPESYVFASVRLRDNKELLELALESGKQASIIFGNSSGRLRNDRDMLRFAAKKSMKWKSADKWNGVKEKTILRSDFNNLDCSLESLRSFFKESILLRFAADDIRDDKQLVLGIVSRSGYSLEYASARLRGDAEVVLAAVKSGAEYVLDFTTKELLADVLGLIGTENKENRLEIIMALTELCKSKKSMDEISRLLVDSKGVQMCRGRKV